MRLRARFPTAGLVLALASALPLAAQARECQFDLGRGWPPAVGNYGGAVETLFNNGRVPMLSVITLPTRGEESGVALVPGADGRAWTIRASRADSRVYHWNSSTRGGGVELRTDQEPKLYQAQIPAPLAQRLLRTWQAALEGVVPAERTAPVLEGEVMSFEVDGQRYSGTRPDCGPGKLILQQAALLAEAADTKEKKLERRWEDLSESLDELQTLLDGKAG